MLIRILTIITAGSLSHFCFDWSGKSILAAPFFPVNESVWEHLKMVHFAILVVIIKDYKQYHKPGYSLSRLISVLSFDLFIVIFYYGYTMITGRFILWLDIFSFISGAILSEYIFAKIFKYKSRTSIPGWIGMVILFIVQGIFTFMPPEIELFKDPRNQKYGIIATQPVLR